MANTALFMNQGSQSGAPSGPAEDDDLDTNQAEDPEADGVLPLPETGPNSYENWIARVEQAKETNEDRIQKSGDAAQRRWDNKPRRGSDLQHTEDMYVPSTYSRIEQKKASFISQNPYVNVSAKHPDAVAVAPLMEAIINDQLGAPQPEGVDAMVMLRECMHDVLVPAGFFGCHIGYEAFIPPKQPTKQIQQGMKPDPNWKPPAPAPVGPGVPPGQVPPPPPQPPMIPNMVEVPNIIFERYFMDRVSPRKLLWSDDFRGSDYDRSSWVACHGNMDFFKAKLKWKLPDDFEAFSKRDEDIVCAEDNKLKTDKKKQIHYYIIYYNACTFDKTVTHPYKIRTLVLVDGIKEAVYHKDCDFQWENEDGTLGGMMGYPLHIGALRAASDTAFPRSDADIWKYQDEEISEGRTDMKLQRKGNVPGRAVDISKLKEGGFAKMERGIYQALMPFGKECFEDGKFTAIYPIPQVPYAQENFTFDNLANRDMDAAAGLGSAPGGAIPQGTTSTSATQAGAADNASGSRMGLERNVFYHWYARGVQKLSVLFQHFMDNDQYVAMLDKNGAQVLQQWNKNNIQGRFTFEIEHNSSIDQSEQRNEFMQFYNLTAKDPAFNHHELDMELVSLFGKDPQKMMAPPPNPPPPPTPALPHGVTLTLDEKGLNPLNPAFPIIMAMITQLGIVVPPTAIAQAQQQAAKTGLPTAAAGNVVNGAVQTAPPAPAPGGPPPIGPGGPGAPPPMMMPQPAPQQMGEGSATKAEPASKKAFERSGEMPGPKGKE